jgi:hypothetical protein
MRNDAQELIGINKKKSSKINLILEKNEIETITFFQQVDGDIFLKRIARKCQEIERISLAR